MIKIYNDIGEQYKLSFQDEATPIASGIISLHNNVMFYIIIIITIVSYIIIVRMISKKEINWLKNINHSTTIELIWTIIPAIILVLIAIPSFKLLYATDEILKPNVTLKIKGNQWYWNYEISDIDKLNINFDSYTKSEDDLELGELRLLEVDNRVLLPINTQIRLLITGEDVIHSFFIPSFGIKTDAIPGRINHANLFILRPGVFFGQCAELCGSGHSRMSIVVEAVTKKEYVKWLSTFITE